MVRLLPAGTKAADPQRRVTPISETPSLAAGPGAPVITLAGSGEPLAPDLRRQLENGFGADLSAVRVHQGETASHLALAHGARAFAFGHHVVLGQRAHPHDVALLAHEVAHVLQQQSAPVVQRCTGGACTCSACSGRSASESEAAQAAQAVTSGGTFTVSGHAATMTPQHADEDEGFLVSTIWSLLESHAPNLVPIIRRGPEGVLDWVKDKVSGAVKNLVDTMMGPVRAIAGPGTFLHTHFGPLVAWMQDAAAKIAQNDCKPISEAIQKIEDLAAKLITPIVEKLQEIAGKIGDFLKGVWDKFGAPVWEFIKKYAAAQFEQLQNLAEWIWDKTAPVRNLAARAWTWLKNKIGIGEGPEGQNGILQWVQAKAGAAWDWVQKKIEPYKKQIQTVAAVVGGILVMISPAGPIILAGAAIYGVVQGVRWLRANLAGGNAIVRARAYAQNVLIPQLMAAINKMTGAITKMAASVSGKLGQFADGLGKVVGAAASTALQFLVDAAQWLAQKAVDLAAWASEKLNALVKWIETGIERLRAFLQPVLNFFIKVGNLLIDIYGLPILLAGELWNKIPSCIRDPFIDWIGPLILGQIEIFKELVKNDEAWQKTKADVKNIIHLVFVTKDLKGAIKATFNLILRVFNVPIELLLKVIQKAQVAWDTVTSAPIKFLKNCVRTVGMAFKMYGAKLFDNLLGGIEGWLFGEVAQQGIKRPKSWTDPWDLMQLALDVMGLSVNHVIDVLEKNNRISKETAISLKKWWQRITRAWDWIMEMRGKSPGEVTEAIISNAKDFAKIVLEGIVTWIVEQVSIEIAEMATAAAASAGLSEVLDAIRRIYRAIKTAVRWMRTILEMIDKGLDAVMEIAGGAIAGPAGLVLDAMKRGTPAVIGFLADQVGLSGVGDKIREIIEKIREKVDKAILAIYDKLKAIFASIIQAAKGAASAILNWWSKRVGFKSEEGKPHSIQLEGKPPAVRVVVESDRSYLEDIVARIPASYTNIRKEAETQRNVIEKLIRELDRLGARGKIDATGSDKEINDKSDDLDKALVKMGEILARGKVLDVADPDLPRPKYTFDVDSAGRAEQAVAEDLSANRPIGSAPYHSPVGWTYLQAADHVQGAPYFRRLHLINHRLGGPGQRQNLVPGTQSDNSTMEVGFESAIKTLIGDEPMQPNKSAVVKMTVKVSYGHSAKKLKCKGANDDASNFPSLITGWFTYRDAPGKKEKQGSPRLKLTLYPKDLDPPP